MCAGCVSTQGYPTQPFLCSSTVQECSDLWPGDRAGVGGTQQAHTPTGLGSITHCSSSPNQAGLRHYMKHAEAQQIVHSDLLSQISNEHAQGTAKNFMTVGTKKVSANARTIMLIRIILIHSLSVRIRVSIWYSQEGATKVMSRLCEWVYLGE